MPSDEIRVSSRGTRVPNYVDDVQDFEQFDDDEIEAGTYGEPAVMKEEDEIEMVLSHSRAEEYLNDPEDNWYTNIVRVLHVHFSLMLAHGGRAEVPYQVEELFAPP